MNTNYYTALRLFAQFYCVVSNCVACGYDLNHLFVRPAGKSSEWAERCFCKHHSCGLFKHRRLRPEVPGRQYMIAAGTISDQSELKFDHEV